jgi:GNAT superfamily N-acetyltransferase
VEVRYRQADDSPEVERFLERHHSARVARLGELVYPLDHPTLIAEADGRLAGVLTYIVDGSRYEILTLHTAEPWRGTGTALVEALEHVAAERGCTFLVVITTNDNVDALRFYQRRGFSLIALHRGAVEDSRARLKPEIPMEGNYGIPLRDEIELGKPI